MGDDEQSQQMIEFVSLHSLARALLRPRAYTDCNHLGRPSHRRSDGSRRRPRRSVGQPAEEAGAGPKSLQELGRPAATPTINRRLIDLRLCASAELLMENDLPPAVAGLLVVVV
jgi:hypothetical protein